MLAEVDPSVDGLTENTANPVEGISGLKRLVGYVYYTLYISVPYVAISLISFSEILV